MRYSHTHTHTHTQVQSIYMYCKALYSRHYYCYHHHHRCNHTNLDGMARPRAKDRGDDLQIRR